MDRCVTCTRDNVIITIYHCTNIEGVFGEQINLHFQGNSDT